MCRNECECAQSSAKGRGHKNTKGQRTHCGHDNNHLIIVGTKPIVAGVPSNICVIVHQLGSRHVSHNHGVAEALEYKVSISKDMGEVLGILRKGLYCCWLSSSYIPETNQWYYAIVRVRTQVGARWRRESQPSRPGGASGEHPRYSPHPCWDLTSICI